jgi:hypothetical protein
MTTAPSTSRLTSETTIAQSTYDEAVRVTEAYTIQLHQRRHNTHSDPAERQRRIDEATAQLEAAERAEYAAWQQLEHLRQLAIKRPWTTV